MGLLPGVTMSWIDWCVCIVAGEITALVIFAFIGLCLKIKQLKKEGKI